MVHGGFGGLPCSTVARASRRRWRRRSSAFCASLRPRRAVRSWRPERTNSKQDSTETFELIVVFQRLDAQATLSSNVQGGLHTKQRQIRANMTCSFPGPQFHLSIGQAVFWIGMAIPIPNWPSKKHKWRGPSKASKLQDCHSIAR